MDHKLWVQTKRYYGQRLMRKNWNKIKDKWGETQANRYYDIVLLFRIDEEVKAWEVNFEDFTFPNFQSFCETYFFDDQQQELINHYVNTKVLRYIFWKPTYKVQPCSN